MTYEEVQKYLRNYSLTEPPYDPNGAIHLLLAIVENLQENYTENDFQDYSSALSNENEAFLSKLLEHILVVELLIANKKKATL